MRVQRSARIVPHRDGVLLMPAAAVVVHQLRYWLAYGSRANAELAAQGHSYLHSLVPWTILAVAVGAGLFLRRIAHALRTGEQGRVARLSAGWLWLAGWAALVLIYATQETLEALLATGHPAGVAGVFGHGGWWAVPAAAGVALVVAGLLLVGRTLLRVAATARRVPRRARTKVFAPIDVAAAAVKPMARAAAGRAPPLGLLFS